MKRTRQTNDYVFNRDDMQFFRTNLTASSRMVNYVNLSLEVGTN